MMSFVNKYVSSCNTCQHYKPAHHPHSVLQPHDIPGGPWQTVSMDLIMGLPQVSGYNAIAVYIDHCSKQVYVISTMSDINAEGMADIHYQEVFRPHRVPTKIISDCSPQFAVHFIKALYHKLGITHALTTVYHPQSNSQTERTNQEVK